MHELGILTQVVDTVEKIAEENDVKKIGEITLEIGELSGVLPQFMEQLFPVVTEGEPLFSETTLRLITVPGEGLCRECEALYNIMEFEGKCPVCGSRDKKVIGGQEFVLKSVSVLE
jgi:hydrogenase nickel incorporation protein HypA/HybF